LFYVTVILAMGILYTANAHHYEGPPFSHEGLKILII